MAGVRLEYDAAAVLSRLNVIAAVLDDPQRMLREMGEELLDSTRQRFNSQTAPDGSAWEPLKPAYQRRKKKNADRILVLDGYLKNLLRYQVTRDELVLGSDRPYAAIHQFGGTIAIAARSQQAYFRRDKSGEVGRQFVKKARSNFAQRVTIGAHTITIDARPWLGVSAQDEIRLLEIATRHLENPTL